MSDQKSNTGARRRYWFGAPAGLICLMLSSAVYGAGRDGSNANGFLQRLSGSETLSAALFGTGNAWDNTFERWQAWKKQHHLPVTVGAHHWFHVNNGGPHDSGYGIPGLEGTYYWFAVADPQLDTGNPAFPEVGTHVDFRFRDSSDKFRSFYDHTYWFYEGYAYVDTPMGRFKGGRIWKRFGLDWDETWWGDVQYFDGLKLDTGDGLSWENTWQPAGSLELKSIVQYFVREAGISGSLAGANPQSVPGSHERNLGVIRLLTTWRLTGTSSLAVGVSGLAGEVRNVAALGSDKTQLAWAVDIVYTRNSLKLFAEGDQSYGTINPHRYVSGGPSNRITDVLAGASYRYGPVTFRIAWSAGFDAHPGGRQLLWDPGVTVDITRFLKLYAEYVRWDVIDRADRHVLLEDGFQLVLHWQV